MSAALEKSQTILVADDDPTIQRLIRSHLIQQGYQTIVVSTGKDVLREMGIEEISLLLLDVKMPGMDGIETLKRIREKYPDLMVIMISGEGTIEIAVQAMKLGAFDFITKPFQGSRLIITVQNALKVHEMTEELSDLKAELKDKYRFKNIIGESGKMKEIYRTLEKVSKSNVTVLLMGESGTGKELIARAIHNTSARKDKPFIAFNCAAIPENLLETELFGHEKGAFTGAEKRRIGKLEIADGGTILCDEVGEMTPAVQAKILRFLQERELERVGGNELIHVDVRIIAATNRDLSDMIDKGTFREDLYYRLSVVPILIPPLRDRKEDISLLTHHFLNKYADKSKENFPEISKEVMKLFLSYEWPGNIRELENVINRAVVVRKENIITPEDLPFFVQAVTHTQQVQEKNLGEQLVQLNRLLPDIVEIVKAEVIKEILKKNKGNIRLAAEKLGVSRGMIYRHIGEKEK